MKNRLGQGGKRDMILPQAQKFWWEKHFGKNCLIKTRNLTTPSPQIFKISKFDSPSSLKILGTLVKSDEEHYCMKHFLFFINNI